VGIGRRVAIGGAAVAAGALAVARPVLDAGVATVEARMNRVHHDPSGPIPAAAAGLHATLRVADLHADSLLWGRDLLVRGDRGHVDVPRLIEGNVALQVLAASVRVPRGINYDRNEDTSDQVILIALAKRWPPRTWRSPLARALHLADRALDLADRSGGRFRVVTTRDELARALRIRELDPGTTAGLLSIEGGAPLEGDPANLDVLAAAGFRMLSPAHLVDTPFAGSAQGAEQHGLTAAGRELLRRAEEQCVLFDVAHASSRTIDDVLARATRPVVASHTGVRGIVDNGRNLGDAHLEGIAATGGVVGIGFWEHACGGTGAEAIAASVAYAVERIGADHVALGSDWDGAVAVPFDAAGLARLTAALLDVGLDEAAVRAVMGETVLRLLATTLPGS
jgi:microsomal dipeptidase-like Zn-dependent dipeptidase